jgi:hypothetical protein
VWLPTKTPKPYSLLETLIETVLHPTPLTAVLFVQLAGMRFHMDSLNTPQDTSVNLPIPYHQRDVEILQEELFEKLLILFAKIVGFARLHD